MTEYPIVPTRSSTTKAPAAISTSRGVIVRAMSLVPEERRRGGVASLPRFGHLDAVEQRRVRVEHDVGPAGRSRIAEARPRERLEEPGHGFGVARRLESLPVRLCLDVAGDDVLQRLR